MEARISMTAVLAAACVLTACSKPSPAANDQPAAPSEPASAPAPAAAPSDAAQKAALASLPVAYQSADLDNGQAKFALCKSCHTIAAGGPTMTGPNLWGVFGRKAGTVPGFAYSDGLKAAGFTWNAAHLDQWISNPRAVVPATKMTYIGMQSAKDRTDLIAYLKVATSPRS
jgi:cytochrome c